MNLFIRSTGNISPQKTFENNVLTGYIIAHTGNRLNCIEPDYRSYIDAKLIRRMSRIIKMGVASAVKCLQHAGVPVPDAIITGTAYGCLEDTGVFLSRMVEQQEELLAPTAFIQSTHNTVGAQVALLLHCTGYNNVFVHRNFSFENALLDAYMLLKEKEARNVLVGGMDEITAYSYAILSRMAMYKAPNFSAPNLYTQQSKGSIAGEGAAFFLLTSESSGNEYAQLNGLETFYRPSGIKDTTDRIDSFLDSHSLFPVDIDLLICGRNGDLINDRVYDELADTIFAGVETVNYKHLCGEYPTSTAFALWMAENIIRSQVIPGTFERGVKNTKKIKTILIYNQSQNIHHSLLLIQAC